MLCHIFKNTSRLNFDKTFDVTEESARVQRENVFLGLWRWLCFKMEVLKMELENGVQQPVCFQRSYKHAQGRAVKPTLNPFRTNNGIVMTAANRRAFVFKFQFRLHKGAKFLILCNPTSARVVHCVFTVQPSTNCFSQSFLGSHQTAHGTRSLG